MSSIQNKLQLYKDKEPEIIFQWKDAETSARGWVVINSLKNGAAGGGTRMRKGLTREEVVSLAKVMEMKFAVCGPPIGGAKSGIDFDPTDPRKDEVLERWYAAVLPLLKYYYGTGGDLNVDELKDVIPITEELGLWHPQEGIVNGYLQANEGEKVNYIGQLRYGCAKIVKDRSYVPNVVEHYAVADMITGWGVSESIKHFYDLFKNEKLEGKRVIIQGWGNVASAAGYYLASQGAKIVGIIDKIGGIIDVEGLTLDEVTTLFVNKDGNKLSSDKIEDFQAVNERIWDLKADIFVPGAASKIVSANQINRLIENGLEVVSCGANVPFVDDKVFFGETAFDVDRRITLIPDFIANCGMARVFAYLMSPKVDMSDQSIFEDVSNTIKNALYELKNEDSNTKQISERALFALLKDI